MVIVKLKGGLGNQMFQYAAARGLAGTGSVLADKSFLGIDKISTDNFTARNYALNVFPFIKIKAAADLLLRILLNPSKRYVLARKLFFSQFKVVQQNENELVTNFFTPSASIYLDGYFQSEKYFTSAREKLLKEFTFPEPDEKNKEMAGRISLYQNPVSIHIRRGDYLKPAVKGYHGLLTEQYYKSAIAELEKEVTDPFYFIFSDDPGWCNLNILSGKNNSLIVEINDAETAWQDMYLMTLCKHHILANSSFSWWGAWLSTNKDQVNIAPAKWFNSEVVNFDIHNVIPSSWRIINYE